ncbi:MAG: hypothetical protein WB565_10095 [Acidimicrobiales bacterium]
MAKGVFGWIVEGSGWAPPAGEVLDFALENGELHIRPDEADSPDIVIPPEVVSYFRIDVKRGGWGLNGAKGVDSAGLIPIAMIKLSKAMRFTVETDDGRVVIQTDGASKKARRMLDEFRERWLLGR